MGLKMVARKDRNANRYQPCRSPRERGKLVVLLRPVKNSSAPSDQLAKCLPPIPAGLHATEHKGKKPLGIRDAAERMWKINEIPLTCVATSAVFTHRLLLLPPFLQ